MKYFFTLTISLLSIVSNAQIIGEAYSVQNDAGITGSYGQFHHRAKDFNQDLIELGGQDYTAKNWFWGIHFYSKDDKNKYLWSTNDLRYHKLGSFTYNNTEIKVKGWQWKWSREAALPIIQDYLQVEFGTNGAYGLTKMKSDNKTYKAIQHSWMWGGNAGISLFIGSLYLGGEYGILSDFTKGKWKKVKGFSEDPEYFRLSHTYWSAKIGWNI